MANIAGSYDPNAEASGDFEPVPAGDYRAKIIESDIEDISKTSNKGRCLKLTWQIETGPYDNRLVWQRLNMWAKDMDNLDKVITIANQQFAAIREATGKLAPQDSSELHYIPCTIRVAVKIDPTGKYGPQNQVKSVKAIGGGSAAPAQQRFGAPPASRPAPAQAAASSAPAGSGRPWPARQSA